MDYANKTMKACNLHAIGDLRYEDLPLPKPSAGQVLVKVMAAGICGSDLPRVFDNGTYHFPTVPGHEFAGVIEDAEDKTLVGKRVAVFPLVPCRKCAPCETGNYAQCENYDYYGSRCDGGFAEYIAVNEWNMIAIPDNVSYEEAAMCEPAAVAVHALSQAGINIGDTAAIFGAGPIGLILGQWAAAWGASKVFLTDIDPHKVAFAKAQGFEHVINSAEVNPIEYIKSETGGRGVDLAVEGAGVSATLEQCLFSAKAFGRVVTMGNPVADMKLSQKAYWEILRKQLKLAGTWNSSFSKSQNDWETALWAMGAGKLSLKPLISHKFPLSGCNAAFNLMRDRKEFFNKVMFVNA